MLPLTTVSGPLASLSAISAGRPLIVIEIGAVPGVPLTKAKFFALRLESSVFFSVIVSAVSAVMTVFWPTCRASASTAAALANWEVWKTS